MQSQFKDYLQSIPTQRLSNAGERFSQTIRAQVGYISRVSPFPHIMDSRDELRISKATKTLLSLITSLPQRVFDNDWTSLLGFLQLDSEEVERYGLTLDAPYLDAMARPDIYLYEDGLKFLEVNIDSSVGGIDVVDRINHLLKESVLLSPFLEKHPGLKLKDTMGNYEELLLSTLQKHYGSIPEKRMGLWEFEDYFEKYHPSYSAHIKQALEARGWQVSLLNETNTTERNGQLFVDGRLVPLLHRVFVAAEFKELGESRMLESMQPYFRVQRAKKLPILCDLSSHLYSAKALFDVLTDEQYHRFFSEEEAEFITHHVPWTRRVLSRKTTFQGSEIDLIPHVARHKDDFVLKPSIGHGGIGVVVGKEQDDETWKQTLAQAERQKQWVVQEVLEKPTALFPRVHGDQIEWSSFQMVHGALFLGGELSTTLIRAQPASGSRVINVLQGAELVVCAVQET